jgi:hypothetical protein
MTDRDKLTEAELVRGYRAAPYVVQSLLDVMAELQLVNTALVAAEDDPRRVARERAIGYLVRAVRCLKAISESTPMRSGAEIEQQARADAASE